MHIVKKSALIILLFTVAVLNAQQRDSLFSQGKSEFERGLYYNAIAKFEKILTKDSSDAESYNAIGLVHYKMKKYDLALKDFENAVAANADYAMAFYNLGVVHFKEERYQDAKNTFDDAITLDESQADFYYNRGLANERISDTTSAIKDFKTCLTLQPEDDQALLKLANWEYELEAYQDALDHATQSEALGNKKAKKLVKRAKHALFVESVKVPEELIEENKTKTKE